MDLKKMKKLPLLFENNRLWAKSQVEQNASFFKDMAKVQDPNYLWIGCSDSRVPANEIVGLAAGELFVHRNVANLFPHTDFSALSVLEYAVDLLQVEHIIVCGHYGCGGVKAAMQEHGLGLVDNWLRHIRDVYDRFKEELEKMEDPIDRFNRLVELNVRQQLLNVCHTTIIQKAWAKGQPLCVHGWIYDLESGFLKDLNCCVSNVAQLEKIYRLEIM